MPVIGCFTDPDGSGNTEFNGVAGYKVTSNKDGYTDRSIFLPAAGYRYGLGRDTGGSYGRYWSSSLCTTDHPDYGACDAYCLFFNSGSHRTGKPNRCNGFSVRPVLP